MASTKKLTITEVNKRLRIIHCDRVMLDESTYVNTYTKARFIDTEFGEWFAKPNDILQGKSHPKLRGFKSNLNRMVSVEKIKQRLFNWYGNIVTIDESTFVNTHTKAKFIDKEYGEWWARPYSVCGGHGHFKRKCMEQIKPIFILPVNAIGTFNMKGIDLETISLNKICGIYCILNTRNGLKYIGLSDDVSLRFLQHKSKLRRGKHPNPHLQNSWNKYGEETFKFVVIEISSIEQLAKRESYWIKFYKATNRKYGYNIKD